jgi:GAF domain-containing protein
MSQRNRKYKRIEALFSKGQQVAPDSPLRAAAKTTAPGTPAEDLMGLVEEKKSQPSAEDTRPESVVPPTAVSPVSGWQDFINGIDRGQKMGFTYNHEKVSSLDETHLPLPENALFVPLMVSGKMIGAIQGAGNEVGWTTQEIEIVSAVAAQLARHLENLSLLEQNEKHTHE